jgi:preprotein translocase subunit SecG
MSLAAIVIIILAIVMVIVVALQASAPRSIMAATNNFLPADGVWTAAS